MPHKLCAPLNPRKPVDAVPDAPFQPLRYHRATPSDFEVYFPILRFARRVLRADALTLVMRRAESETLLIADNDGVREAHDSASLGVVAAGRRVLTEGTGILQAAEIETVLGFLPTECFGAPFPPRQGRSRGALAAWNRATGRWTPADGALLREIAALVLQLHATTVFSNAAAPERHREIFERSAEPIFLTDQDGVVLEANPAAGATFGMAVGAEHRRASEFFVEPSDWDRLLQYVAAASAPFRVESRLRRPDGRFVDCVLAVTPWLDPEGTLAGQLIVVHDVSGRKQLEERLRRAALHDPLTDLPNRGLFIDRLAQALTRIRRHPSHGFAVVFLDLDGFKAINDTLGHHRGDELLTSTARRLESSLRGVDTVARIGGDEFAILLDEVPNAHVARKLVERIVAALAPPFQVGGQEVYVTPSVGVTLGSPKYGSPGEVLQDADAAMYLSRRHRSEGYRIFDETMRGEWEAQVALETGLREALDESRLRLSFQPIVWLISGDIADLEAIVLWDHPERGVLGSEAFGKVADDAGLALPIARWAVAEICRQVKGWSERHGVALGRRRIMLRLTAAQARPELLPALRAAEVDTGVDPSIFRFGVEEAALTGKPALIVDFARELALLDVGLEITGVGSAPSPLELLHRLPLSALNIDATLVRSLTDSGNRPRPARTIIALAHALGVQAVASGVETSEQAELLKQAGCDRAEGAFLAPPVDPEHVPALLGSARPAIGKRRAPESFTTTP